MYGAYSWEDLQVVKDCVVSMEWMLTGGIRVWSGYVVAGESLCVWL